MLTDVSIVRCTDCDQKTVMSSVRRAVDLIGGINSFVSPGERILLKPDLLKARPPEAALTTHREVVRAVIQLVHDAGRMPWSVTARASVVCDGSAKGPGSLLRSNRRSGPVRI